MGDVANLGGGDAVVDAAVLCSCLGDVQVRHDISVVCFERSDSQWALVNNLSAVGVPGKTNKTFS